ncbi:MAG: hypothetical protein J5614_06790, partial [Paludibacteraceae bacterium]|nr:hypothetical protein [Paludibacteraceae bacterium]
MAESKEQRAIRIADLIDAAIDDLEQGPEDKREAVSYLNSLLKIEQDYFTKSDDTELLERLKTERRKRELMEQEHELKKKETYSNIGCNIGNAVVNAADRAVGHIQHVSDVNKVLTVESGGRLGT